MHWLTNKIGNPQYQSRANTQLGQSLMITWLWTYLPRLKLRSEPALRRWLTFRERAVEDLIVERPSSSARCAKGSTFSEPPIPL